VIGAKVMLDDDTEVASVWLRAKPSAGELLWFGDKVKAETGHTSFVITEVAHWVSTGWSPNTHTGEPVHTLAVYVKPALDLSA
jgi:hypothetical protein